MQEVHAVSLADEFIRLMLQHQSIVLPQGTFADDEQARTAAQAIATFRQELIARLMQQP